MDKLGLIVGEVLVLVGLFYIDKFLIPTLDYFGKYVFFVLFNIMTIYLVYTFRRYKFMPIVIGVIILLVGWYIGG